MNKKTGTIGIYYDPKTGRYARQTRRNAQGHHEFIWKEAADLPDRFIPKIGMLNLAEFAVKIPELGIKRRSRYHPSLIAFYFYNEAWRKEL